MGVRAGVFKWMFAGMGGHPGVDYGAGQPLQLLLLLLLPAALAMLQPASTTHTGE